MGRQITDKKRESLTDDDYYYEGGREGGRQYLPRKLEVPIEI